MPYIPPTKEGVFAHYGQKGPFFNFVSRGARNVVSVIRGFGGGGGWWWVVEP